MKVFLRNLHCVSERTAPAAAIAANLDTHRFQVTRSLHDKTRDDLHDEDGYLKFDTLHEMITNATKVYERNPLFGTYSAAAAAAATASQDGTYEWMTYSDFATDVSHCRSVLRDQLGVQPHSKVGIISNNRREWATLAAATYSLNAALVPMYEAQLPQDWTHILNDSECRTLICSSEEIYRKAKKEALPNCPLVMEVLCLDAPEEEPHSFRGAMARAAAAACGEEGHSSVVEPTPEDLANLIYTSGTTGKPKGVELIHSNQVSNIKAGRDMGNDPSDFPQEDDRSLAFLPWAHSYGQTCELWYLMSQGASMGICRGIPHILDDLQMVRPTLLYAVPTLYKKVHDGVINAMQSASPIRQTLMRSALRLGKAHAAHENAGFYGYDEGEVPPLGFVDGTMHKLLDDIVLSKIRDRFGGNLRAGFVAGAACPKEITTFMDAIGIPICEGYGLTETSPVIALNVLSRRKAGSVGQVLKGVDVWVLDSEGKPLGPGQEGEICCSGPNVMRGYHNNPTATNDVITLAPDGKSKLFHTGDLGKISADGFLSVTGRLKEQYKLENGKYVCPTPIEEAIGMSRFISQVVVTGANRPYNVALVVPDWMAIRSELNLSEDDVAEEELVNDTRVKGLISAEIKLNCYSIKKFEVPMAYLIVAPFTAANNMVTPKMSIRRHVVVKTYEDMISDLYDGNVGCGGYLGSQEKQNAA
eukprot:CAMPEP_0183703644 /NCGR_PEP_ID=MMETSP0737-20130205/1321_1 /TAXON_ID=385413 /ORGANISM="Thalassiosira miniscula, Strain CCMP1093" /LENGTH=699 /DNA_ID=CAMNT_0025930441 /DNA_START=117 /DNA_END=2216 /DNA_ORIENTATION=+